ncbi:MAG: diaminopimelate epimerase [Actinomycetota bacterium]
MRFTKAHGTGNDFVVVGDLEDGWQPNEAFVAAVCDRHFGVGADGLIRIGAPRDGGIVFMDYWNADGSTAEMCGNGVRVVAKWLADRDLVASESVAIATRGGVKTVRTEMGEDGKVSHVTVDMGQPALEPSQVPTNAPDANKIELTYGDTVMTAVGVSMGNPHAVIFVDDLDAIDFERLGPAFESDPTFPAKANIEFVQQLGEDHLRMRVWERGVGETLACGTGACAVGVAAHLRGLTSNQTLVSLRGGDLEIEWTKDSGTVLMRGPAVEVFEGELTESLKALLD